MADHSHRPRRLNYGNVQLFKKDTLGIGSYGMVCKAMCGQLPCAAKLLHDTLFHHGDPGEYDLMAKFEQECQFLSGIHHPNIVQYLCTLRDRDSRRPVLLMELMEENLTKFLGRSTKPLPYHLQVGISRDISLALSYLHLNGIIHRDLSSNNILLTAEKRAKVTDFGMSKFADAGSRKTLTQMPGTQVYMPPEAKTTPPRYTDKLDCFSLGVLMIQIATRKFPEPSEATELVEVNDPRFQSNRVMVFIPEQKRRQEHIGEIEPGHPLLHTALKCIADEEDNRPTSLTICNDLTKENAHFQRGLEDERRKSEAEEKQHREEVRNLNRKLGEANKDIAYFRGRVMELEQEVFDLRNRLKRNEEATKARERDLENTKQSYQGEVERLRRELEKVYAETRRVSKYIHTYVHTYVHYVRK